VCLTRCRHSYLMNDDDESRSRRPLNVAVKEHWLFESDIIIMARTLLKTRPFRAHQVRLQSGASSFTE